MSELLRDAHASFLKMTPRDGIKLLYQAVLGCGHFAADPCSARQRLQKEWEETTPLPLAPLLTPLDGAYGRLDLHAAKAQQIPPELVLRLFLASAKATDSADTARLDEVLAAVSPADCGFSAEEWQTEVNALRASGYAPVSHSDAYRNAYDPAYRVVSMAYARWLPLLTLIEKKLAEKPSIILAVDGRAASGKSTFADAIAHLYGASILHMDDFFLPFAQKTKERMEEAGGNVDYERFAAEVLPQLTGVSPITYRPFSCRYQALQEPVTLTRTSVVVVEGSYTLHPRMTFLYDLSFFITVSPKVQSERILVRNGEEKHRRYMEEWIPMEEKYFKEAHVSERADVRFDTESELLR